MEDADREEEDKKDMLFMRINEGLTLHADIEETLIYPKLQSLEETRELTSMAYQEHDIVKNLLTELEMIPYDSEEWTPKANVLMENVRHHVEEEEDDLLPKAESSLGEEEQRMLGREVETYLTTREENSLPSA